MKLRKVLLSLTNNAKLSLCDKNHQTFTKFERQPSILDTGPDSLTARSIN